MFFTFEHRVMKPVRQSLQVLSLFFFDKVSYKFFLASRLQLTVEHGCVIKLAVLDKVHNEL